MVKAERDYKISVPLSEEERKALYYICEGGLPMTVAVRIMILAVANGWVRIRPEFQDNFDAMFDSYTGGYKYER